jgi:hypothetical protein
MIREEFAQALLAASKLTRSEQSALASLLIKSPRSTDDCSLTPAVEVPKRASNRCARWSDEDTQRVKEFLEDLTIMSDRSRRQAKRALCRELGRTEDGIKQKIFQLQNMDTAQC